jgi:hypothetical protein
MGTSYPLEAVRPCGWLILRAIWNGQVVRQVVRFTTWPVAAINVCGKLNVFGFSGLIRL